MSPLPHNLAVEEGVLGRMMIRPDAIADIIKTLAPSDFYHPLNGRIFAALVAGWRQGEPLDSISLTVEVPDLDARWLAQVLVDAPAHHERLVRELVGLRIRRDVILAAAEATEAARDLSKEPLEALDAASTAMASIDAPSENVRDLWRLDEFIDQPETTDPWVIRGMFRAGWRAVIVATEGRGKSWLSRQIAMCAASGVHPLFGTPIPPINTLVVDLENPAGSIAEAGKAIRDAARRFGTYDPDRCFLWHRPGGIDLRTRADRAQLEGVIAQCRPEFVSVGPLYKTYTIRAAEGQELPAGEVQNVFDDLRTRYGFALLLEHHAPKAQGGFRDIAPYGSSLWLRWPELGLKLTPWRDEKGNDRDDVLSVGRWRADRMRNAWPQRIERGESWPWVGRWDDSFATSMEAVA